MSSPTQFPWQNINKTTVLKKGRGYFVVPAVTNADVSDNIISGISPAETYMPNMLGKFNFTSPNNFSLTSFPGKPEVNGGYVLCIAYREDDIVYRYRLWTPYDSVEDINELYDIPSDKIFFPLYTGQVIKKNFTIEIWSTGNNTFISDGLGHTTPDIDVTFSELTFITSIMQTKLTATDPDTTKLFLTDGLCVNLDINSVYGAFGWTDPLTIPACAAGSEN